MDESKFVEEIRKLGKVLSGIRLEALLDDISFKQTNAIYSNICFFINESLKEVS